MKKLFSLLFPMIAFALGVSAQYSYEIKMENFRQINETQFQWDVSLRKGVGSSDFALYSMQLRWDFNNNIENSGSFESTDLTINSSVTELFQKAGWFQDADFTVIGTSPNRQFNWATTNVPAGGQAVTVIDATWRKVATFNASLRKATFLHNFADVDPMFAFQSSGAQVIVFRCDAYTGTNPTALMSGEVNQLVDPAGRVMTPALGVKVNDRQLAGYYFTGTGNYNIPERWNNITKANSNTVPGASNNAIIAGSATVNDARTVNQLTVATGGYLLLNQAAQLTTGNLHNDNIAGSSGAITLANWNFEGTGSTLPYSADIGISSNVSIAPFNTTAAFDAFYNFAEHGLPNGTRAPFATAWRPGASTGTQKDWRIQISTLGYQNLKLSSKQWSDVNNDWASTGPGPSQFIVQWSVDGTLWTNITGGTVTVANDWTTGVVNNLDLPSNVNNLSTIYIRWLTNSPKASSGYSSIDDIEITGEALPSGIRVQSDVSGTGSLIHTNTGVNATVERYIPGAAWNEWDNGWHFLSSPVVAQPIDPEFTTEPYDLYCWYEAGNEWVNYQATTGTSWATANTISNGHSNNPTNFLVGKSYLVAYDNNVRKSFTGELNVADVSITDLAITGTSSNFRSWHLLGNPYACALTWSTGWTMDHIGGIAQIWNGMNKSYTARDVSESIPATNGFMVQVNAEPGSLTIPATARTHSALPYFKSSGQKIMLTARNIDNPSAQESVVTFNPEATAGFDFEYDGEFLPGYAPLFYSVAGDEHLCFNSLPELEGTTSIPFSFSKNEGSSFSIEATGASSLPMEAWLMDKKTNTDHNLSVDPVYNFTSFPDDDPERFILHFGTLSIVDDPSNTNFTVWYSQGEIHFSSLPQNVLSLSLVDMTGRELVNSGKVESDVVPLGNKFAPGWYLVRITMKDNLVVKKIFIN